jgi:hypothetical protein
VPHLLLPVVAGFSDRRSDGGSHGRGLLHLSLDLDLKNAKQIV